MKIETTKLSTEDIAHHHLKLLSLDTNSKKWKQFGANQRSEMTARFTRTFK